MRVGKQYSAASNIRFAWYAVTDIWKTPAHQLPKGGYPMLVVNSLRCAWWSLRGEL